MRHKNVVSIGVAIIVVAMAASALALGAVADPTDSADQDTAVEIDVELGPTTSPLLTVKSNFKVNPGIYTLAVLPNANVTPSVNTRMTDVILESGNGAEIKQENQAWVLEAKTDERITVSYKIDLQSSPELTAVDNRKSGLAANLPMFSSSMAIVTGSDVFLLPQDGEGYPWDSYRIRIKAPKGNTVFAPWEQGEDNTYEVSSLDDLWENVIVWGELREYDVTVSSNRLKVVFSKSGRPSSSSEIKTYCDRVGNLFRAALEAFGKMPDLGEDEEVYFICLGPEEIDLQGSHSITYRSSILFFNDSAKIDGSRAVTASKAIVRMWNGYGIVPAAGSQGSKVLWFERGLDDYYGPLLASRAGILSSQDAWSRFSREYTKYASLPEARTLSLREAAEVPEGTDLLSSKGSLSCAILDSKIIEVSHGDADLDRLLAKLLEERNGYQGKRYTLTDISECLEDISPDNWNEFLNKIVNGTEWINLADVSSSELFRDGKNPDSSGSGGSFNWWWLILVAAFIILIPLIFTPYIRRAARIDASWTPSREKGLLGDRESLWGEEDEDEEGFEEEKQDE